MKKGKKYVENLKKVDKDKVYSADEAIKLVKKIANTNFDSSVDVVMHLNLDTKKADQQLRGALVLPNGTGKSVKILVVAKGKAATDAKAAGADYAGEEYLEKISKGWLDFDVMIATPDMMPSLGKLGKILGPKGLMPNPKTGTVTTDPVSAVEEVKKGRVEYRTDSYGNVHALIGKVSFKEDALFENLNTFVTTILKSKPASVKGNFVKNISISSTMGPGVKIDINSFDK